MLYVQQSTSVYKAEETHQATQASPWGVTTRWKTEHTQPAMVVKQAQPYMTDTLIDGEKRLRDAAEQEAPLPPVIEEQTHKASIVKAEEDRLRDVANQKAPLPPVMGEQPHRASILEGEEDRRHCDAEQEAPLPLECEEQLHKAAIFEAKDVRIRDPAERDTSLPIFTEDAGVTLDDLAPPQIVDTNIVSRMEGKSDGVGHGERHSSVVEKDTKEPCWIYLHMDKSGGDSIRHIATERWSKDELIFDNVQWRRGDDYATNVMTHFHWRLLHGGCVEALRAHVNTRQCKWFTLFRHPVARLVSAFNHCQKAPRDPLCASSEATTTDIVEFAERWGDFGLRQFALATVSSDVVKEWAAYSGTQGGGSVWSLLKEYIERGEVAPDAALEGMLESVKGLLSSQYAAVGIVEELDTTMRLFDHTLSMPKMHWTASLERRIEAADYGDFERDAGDEPWRELSDDSRIQRALRLDIALYEHAVDVFRGQVAKYGLA